MRRFAATVATPTRLAARKVIADVRRRGGRWSIAEGGTLVVEPPEAILLAERDLLAHASYHKAAEALIREALGRERRRLRGTVAAPSPNRPTPSMCPTCGKLPRLRFTARRGWFLACPGKRKDGHPP